MTWCTRADGRRNNSMATERGNQSTTEWNIPDQLRRQCGTVRKSDLHFGSVKFNT